MATLAELDPSEPGGFEVSLHQLPARVKSSLQSNGWLSVRAFTQSEDSAAVLVLGCLAWLFYAVLGFSVLSHFGQVLNKSGRLSGLTWRSGPRPNMPRGSESKHGDPGSPRRNSID